MKRVIIFFLYFSAVLLFGQEDVRSLTFLGNQSLPPMVYLQGGVPQGVVVDIVKRLSEVMGRPIVVEPMNWAEAQEIVASGRADALIQINKNEARLKIYDFSSPLLDSRFCMFVRSGTTDVFTAADLRGLRVGVEPRGFPELTLKADTGIIITSIPTILDGFGMLRSGTIDAVVVDEWVGKYILAVNKIHDVNIVGQPIAVQQSAIAVKKDNVDLLNRINAGLAKMRTDGSYDAIIGKWSAKHVVFETLEQIQTRNLKTVTFVAGVFLFFSLLFIALLLRQLSAQKRNKAELEWRSNLLDEISDSVQVLDIQGDIVYANASVFRNTGYSREELKGKNIAALNDPVDAVEVPGRISEIVKLGNLHFSTFRVRKDGTQFPVDVNARLFSGRQGKYIVEIDRDVTERVESQKRTADLLKEKTLILQESQHRIKNNMKTISSLLSLQAHTLTEPSAIAALVDANGRVQSMGLLYDKLFRSANFLEVSVKDYLPALIDEIIGNFPDSRFVTTVKRIEDFVLDAKRQQPLGIIVNELLTNIMKYAFKGRESGLITVSATNTSGHVAVSVRDDGIGMPPSLTFDNPNGFGLQLVAALTEQLDGTIRIERGSGTGIVIEFDI